MAGIVKKKFENELTLIKKEMYREIKRMVIVLPKSFILDDVLSNYKKYYPFKYSWWEDMNSTYIRRNKILVNVNKKPRYKEYSSFHDFLLDIPGVRSLLNKSRKGEILCGTEEEINKYKDRRFVAIKNQRSIIENYKRSLCNGNEPTDIDPLCLEQLILMYKKCDDIEKMQIVYFLMKYFGSRTILLLQEIYEKEKNPYIKEVIFSHLQKLNCYIKLGITQKNNLEYEDYNPEEESFEDLYFYINKSNSFERKKQFHFFISHNINDSEVADEIRKLISEKGYDCYYCWISDDKKGIGKHLGEILDVRIKQSRAVIKVDSDYFRSSKWCQYEIEKSINNKKQIYTYKVGDDINKFVEETIKYFNKVR